MMIISDYLKKLNSRYKLGISREHSYRGDLQALLESIQPNIIVTNEPARVACGAPDYIVTKDDIPAGYIEAKDIGINLPSKAKSEQFQRYLNGGLNPIILTDYLEFHLFVDKVNVSTVKLAEIRSGQITQLPESSTPFLHLISEFCNYSGYTITSPPKLAKMMAGKARILADIIERVVNTDIEAGTSSTLVDQMQAFKEILIHDINPKSFADVYAQTIAYGMFAARVHDRTTSTFSRQEAAELIPKSNPFLRNLFTYIAGPLIDDRIRWVVDALAIVFQSTNMPKLLKNFGKSTGHNDPIIHFYETFLTEYDSILRKERGVWYTPAPIVNFIVNSVDEILQQDFHIPEGLADTTKIPITNQRITKATSDRRSKLKQVEVTQLVHKVQILDPATGTGTFLAEVIKKVRKSLSEKKQLGSWSNYVENHLLPRLNGFEYLMASYVMAHLKLDLLLKETGYKPQNLRRFKIYLTNSLEEYHTDIETLFAQWLSAEANEANYIKRHTPVMCIIGNPPYSGISSNNNKWIKDLINDYKYIDGEHFKEKKHWLNVSVR